MNRRYLVADLDDERPIGGWVRFDLYRGGFGTRVTPSNKRGSRISIPFTCGACSLNVTMRETSLPELFDKIAPHRDIFPAETLPIEQSPDLDADEWIEVMTSGADPGPGEIVGYEQRHVIQLKTLCDIVGTLRERGRR